MSDFYARAMIWALAATVLITVSSIIISEQIANANALNSNGCIAPPNNDSIVGIKKRQALAWVMKCDESQYPGSWENFNDYVSGTFPSLGITEISTIGYALGIDGIDYSPIGSIDGLNCGKLMETNFLIPFLAKHNGVNVYPLIDTGFYSEPPYNQTYGTNTALYQVQYNATARQQFIESAVNKMKTLGFAGYNIDIEIEDGVDARNASAFSNFIKQFANAVAKEGGILNVDVMKCYREGGGTDFMGMTCPEYVQSCVADVVTMNTYNYSASTFQRLVNNDSTVIDPEHQRVGMVARDPSFSQNLDFLGTHHPRITKIALWHCYTLSCFGEANGWVGKYLKNWSMLPVPSA